MNWNEMISKLPKCPKCGGFLIPKDYSDFYAESDHCIEVTIKGECDDCHTPFEWHEEYYFELAYDIEEMKGDKK